MLAALCFTAAFYLGYRWGIVGVAFVWPVLHPLFALPLCFRACKQINLRWRPYWASVRPALSASAVMLVCLVLFKKALLSSSPIYLRLAAEIITGRRYILSYPIGPAPWRVASRLLPVPICYVTQSNRQLSCCA